MQDQRSTTYGLCECGCGQATKLAPCSDSTKGWIKGKPKRFVLGHSNHRNWGFREEDRGYLTPCLIWNGPTRNGYGIDHLQRRMHRVRWEERFGQIPEGVEPDHLCQVKRCANIDHLELVTHTVNVRRGRHTRLTMEIARQIRARWESGERNMTMIATEFGCSRQTINHIVTGHQWREQ